ncbi:MAG: sugar ABC transporter permease [Bacillota bacterium]
MGAAAAGQAKAAGWAAGRRGRIRWIIPLFLLPAVAYTLVFRVAPIGASFYLSLTDYTMLSRPNWVGLENYRRVLFEYDLFWQAFANTVQFALEVLPLNIALALGLALLVNRAIRGIAAFRAIYYLPSVMSVIAASMVWLWLYNTRVGLLNSVLAAVGLPAVNWLGNPGTALHSLVLMRVWKGAGVNMVIYLAGLQGIPVELYEAATIDGAGAFQRFRRITWPLLWPVTFYIIVMGLISTFQTFGEIYAMTQGGPLESTTTVGYLIYQAAFQYFEMGAASAISFVLFVVIFTLSVLQLKAYRSPAEA